MRKWALHSSFLRSFFFFFKHTCIYLTAARCRCWPSASRESSVRSQHPSQHRQQTLKHGHRSRAVAQRDSTLSLTEATFLIVSIPKFQKGKYTRRHRYHIATTAYGHTAFEFTWTESLRLPHKSRHKEANTIWLTYSPPEHTHTHTDLPIENSQILPTYSPHPSLSRSFAHIYARTNCVTRLSLSI